MFVQNALSNGGTIAPLIIPEGSTGGLCNPSIYNDDGKLICVLRRVHYTLYHSRKYPQHYGPLQYIHAENDMTLRTTNYLLEMNDDLSIRSYHEIKMMNLHEPIWEFIGLEDARLFRWEDKLYICGVRRDTTPNGQGRMEICELNEKYEEISRYRIPATEESSYCEKNWVPVLDQPNMFLKWTIPTEIVNIAGRDGVTKTAALVQNNIEVPRDLRGSSHIVPLDDHYVGIMHEVAMFKSQLEQKDANYLHRIVVWDKSWNITYMSDSFYFFDGPIEFCAGACIHNNSFLISFGHQDAAAYVVSVPLDYMRTLCNL